MSFGEFLSHYWWLIFPIFGMVMAILGMGHSERRAKSAMDVIKSYVDQGKEPPPELVRLAAQGDDARDPSAPTSSRAWSFIVFTALAAGLGAGWYFVQGEDWAWALVIGGVVMGVMAVGALLVLMFGRRG